MQNGKYHQGLRDCIFGTVEGNYPILPTVWMNTKDEKFNSIAGVFYNHNDPFGIHVQKMSPIYPKNFNVKEQMGYTSVHVGLFNDTEAAHCDENYTNYITVTLFIPIKLQNWIPINIKK